MTIRIIPRLDIKGPNLVKGIHLEGLRVLGKPEKFARAYYEQGADELLYMDVVASLYQRNNLLDIVSKTAKNIFIPLTVGGGLRTIDDIRKALRSGADKVALNTAAINNPQFVHDAAQEFGSSTIVVSIEAGKMSDGSYECFTDNGRESTGVEVISWAKLAAEYGCGEILITSIDSEGLGKGFDTSLIKNVSQSVNIPVVASGGAGNSDHIVEVIRDGRVDGVCIAAMLHYQLLLQDNFEDEFFEEGNTEYLKHMRTTMAHRTETLFEIKNQLTANGISCRPAGAIF